VGLFANVGDTPQFEGFRAYGNIVFKAMDQHKTDATLFAQANDCLMYNNSIYDDSDTGQAKLACNSGQGTIANNILYRPNGIAGGCVAGTCSNNTDQTTNPGFTDIVTGDFSLTGAVAGLALSSPYNYDMLGTLRGEDGVFDRGALEYVSGAGDITPPTVTSRTIPAAGTSAVLVFDEAVTFANNEPTLAATGGAVSLTYASGTGTDTLTFTTSRQILGAETVTMSYTQAGDGIEDLADNDLASFTDQAVTNSSTQTLVALSNLAPAAGTRLAKTSSSATLEVDTNKAATCRFGYRPGIAWGSLVTYGTTGGTEHSHALSVVTGGVYQICARCLDDAAEQYSADACASWSVAPDHQESPW
jgi:hypothetical protein